MDIDDNCSADGPQYEADCDEHDIYQSDSFQTEAVCELKKDVNCYDACECRREQK